MGWSTSAYALLHADAPDVLLMTGMASEGGVVLIETVACNLDACPAPDNVGDVRLGEQLRPNGPEFYSATIDTAVLCCGLRRLGFPAVVSDDAAGLSATTPFTLRATRLSSPV
jgi:pyrrolidone-carboxylate peptidase